MTRPGDIDDQTAAYILETRMQFEDLRQVAAQLAGFLVLHASGANAASPDHPVLQAAADLHRGAADGVRSARPSARAAPHHRCLVEASADLDAALTLVRTGTAIDGALAPLRRAFARLRDAAGSLPGFEMVSFRHACCAARIPPVTAHNGTRPVRSPLNAHNGTRPVRSERTGS
ncbi:MAG TPA: hypothetical protein VIY49_22100 [Bryobacteraceae bacterium]